MSQLRTILRNTAFAAWACTSLRADGPTALLPADSASTFKLSGAAGDFAKMSTATVAGQPFSSALRIEVTKKTARPADVQITAPVDAAMASGDVLLVSFWMQSATPAEATIDAGFRAGGLDAGAGAPPPARAGRGGFGNAPPLNMPAVAGTSWKKVQFPFALTRAYEKGQGELYFTLGLRPQTVEIGGIELVNYGTSKLPGFVRVNLTFRRDSAVSFSRTPTAAWNRPCCMRVTAQSYGGAPSHSSAHIERVSPASSNGRSPNLIAAILSIITEIANDRWTLAWIPRVAAVPSGGQAGGMESAKSQEEHMSGDN